MIYFADYTQGTDGTWTARLRPLEAPDDYIETSPPRAEFTDCVHDVFDLAPDGAHVELGTVAGEL